jgi:hypothetical protein
MDVSPEPNFKIAGALETRCPGQAGARSQASRCPVPTRPGADHATVSAARLTPRVAMPSITR